MWCEVRRGVLAAHTRRGAAGLVLLALVVSACGARTGLDEGDEESTAGVTDVVSVSAGLFHACVLEASGGASCWGDNRGSIGDGTQTRRPSPVAVVDLDDARQLSAGGEHTCAVRRTGRVSCWGRNYAGQLGDGTIGSSQFRLRPTPVVGLADAILVSAGDTHTCAVLADGSARCWGDNDRGALGDATTVTRSTPVRVRRLESVVDLAAGGDHTCAVVADGRVLCWGANERGQLGDGTTADRPVAAPVEGLEDATAISASLGVSCAVRRSGAVACWGGNDAGGLGDGTRTDSAVPLRVAGVGREATHVSTASGHACAVGRSGWIACWGANDSGQLGDGTRASYAPAAGVRGIDDAVDVSGGSAFTCGLRRTGAVLCWGRGAGGVLGDGTSEPSPVPVSVLGLP